MAPWITPADSSCCGCSLHQSVHTLSMIAMFDGIFSIIALVIGGREDVKGREHLEAIMETSNLLHSVGILFGIRGFIGLHTRNTPNLKVMLCYFPYAWIVNVVVSAVRQPYLCLETLKPEDREKQCDMLVTATWLIVALQFALYSYFTYIIWSLIYKFENTPDPFLGLETDLSLLPLGTGTMAYYPQLGPPPGGVPPRGHHPGSEQHAGGEAHGGQGYGRSQPQNRLNDNFSPFSGQAYQLID